MARGRIIEGTVIDLVQNNHSISEHELDASVPCTIIYRYSNSGVTYESSQVLSQAQINNLQNYRVGVRVNVRYDPRRPANSFVE